MSKRLVAKLKAKRASPDRSTSWLLGSNWFGGEILASSPPDCLPEVGDEDEGVGESQQGGKSSAMENLWIWTTYIARV